MTELKTPVERVEQCPACEMAVPAHYCARGFPSPRPGQITVCGHCGQILIFCVGLSLRKPTLFELHRVMQKDPYQFEHVLDTSDYFRDRARHLRG